MKKQLPGFLTGVIVSALVFTAAPAIAAQIQTITATLNSVNIEVNGQKVAVSGENYTLDNGKQTAGSIVYNETTYVPIRKFGEIMGAEIGYDGGTESVTVKGDVKAPAESTTPPTQEKTTYEKVAELAKTDFSALWYTIDTSKPESSKYIYLVYDASKNGKLSITELESVLNGLEEDALKTSMKNTATEFFNKSSYSEGTVGFSPLGAGNPVASVSFPGAKFGVNTFSYPIDLS